jgi:hypothetical protein
MARSISKDASVTARQRSRPLALGLPRWLFPYLLLALLTLLALTAAYNVRPTTRIDFGDDYDAAFLRNFNSREIDADGIAETFSWAKGQETLTVPGGRDGAWIATLRAAPDAPPGILNDVAVAVNGERVDMPRRSDDSILAKIPARLGTAPALTFSLVSPLVGGAEPPRDVVGEIVLSAARTYRWSRDESAIVLPNLGQGAWTVELGLITIHPDNQPLNAQVFANGVPLAQLPESNVTRRVKLFVPAELMGSGNLELVIRSKTFSDPRPLGVFFSEAVVAPAAGGGLSTAFPPWGSFGYALVAVLGAYGALVAALRGLGDWEIRRLGDQKRLAGVPWGLVGMGAVVLVGGLLLALFRFPVGFMLPSLAGLGLFSLLLMLLLYPFTAWLFRLAGDSAPPWAISAMLIFLLVSFWLKAVGMLFPYFTAIDVQWHMARAQRLIDGELPLFYGTNSPLNESTMPTAEWGENRPIIPYSPYFHMFATVYALLPFPLTFTANMVSLLQDSSRVILIALLARKAGLGWKGAVLGGALFAALPVAYLLHSWGNVPTSFGLWLTLVANTFIIVFWERLHQRWPLLALSFGLLWTFLIYTVTGVFMGVFLVALTVLAWLNARRGGEWVEITKPLRPLWIAGGVAMLLAVLLYYGQYLGPIFERTVPYLGTVFTQGPQSVGVERPPFGQYMWAYLPHLDYYIWRGDYLYYGLLIPLLYTIPGFLAIQKRPATWVAFAAWFSVALLFMLAGYRISMVDKQLFYILPIICVCWAVYAERYWEKGGLWRWSVIITLVFSLISALDQWVLRIATSPVY